MTVEIITMPTLTRLLAISTVAKRRLGFSSRCKTIFPASEGVLFIMSSSLFVREKKAFSDADISAEQTSKRHIETIP